MPELEHRIIELLPVLIIVMMVMLIKIVKVFTQHQQKMAEILNRAAAEQTELASLRKDIAELKSLVHGQIISADGPSQLAPPPTPTVADRLTAGS